MVSPVPQQELAEEELKAEEALRASERKLRFVMESVPQMMFTAKSDGRVEYANGQWLAYSGRPFEQIEGLGWRQLIHQEDLAEHLRLWERSAETGEPFEMEYRLRRTDGEYRWHLCRALAMVNPEGRADLWIGSNTHIHGQKELEQDLERRVHTRTADLDLALRELEGFNYTVAHDLRAPLRAIIFASKFLLQDATDKLTEEQHHLLVSQAANAQKLAKLIDDLLQFSRLSRLPVERVPVDLSELARGVSAEESQEGSLSPCEFKIQDGMACQGDRGLLRLVLVNLIQNACKFSPEGGTVSVGRSHEDAREPFFVRDEGIGFDMTYVEKIFQPFERLHSADQYPGTGIGLSTVRRIVERHNGQIWVESIPQKGTTVYFTVGTAGNE